MFRAPMKSSRQLKLESISPKHESASSLKLSDPYRNPPKTTGFRTCLNLCLNQVGRRCFEL